VPDRPHPVSISQLSPKLSPKLSPVLSPKSSPEPFRDFQPERRLAADSRVALSETLGKLRQQQTGAQAGMDQVDAELQQATDEIETFLKENQP